MAAGAWAEGLGEGDGDTAAKRPPGVEEGREMWSVGPLWLARAPMRKEWKGVWDGGEERRRRGVEQRGEDRLIDYKGAETPDAAPPCARPWSGRVGWVCERRQRSRTLRNWNSYNFN